MNSLEDALRCAPPVIAILRGLTPAEAPAIGEALVAAGIRLIEVPLNSTDPFASIRALQRGFGSEALIGAGTVLDTQAADRLADTGARLLVTPNTDPAVIRHARALGLVPVPGFFTISEAFAAIAAGARHLKLFPASTAGTGHIKALREVLPADVAVWAVGGVDRGNARDWMQAGAAGVALGSALFRPGDSAAVVAERARAIVAAFGEDRASASP